MKSAYLSTPPLPSGSKSRTRIYASLAVMVAVFALSSGRVHAAVTVQLSPSLNSPQPVGTTVTWTASATDTKPGPLYYQFSVRLSGGDYRVVRDFAPSNSFEWTPGEREGSFDVRVVARNISTLDETQLAVTYSVSSRVTGESPVISTTANPLVALYSAPPCEAGSMRVRFWRTGDFTSQSTPWKSCLPGVSRNFYVAGMLAATGYSMRHEVSSDPEAPVTTGPTLSFLTGTLPSGFAPPAASVVIPSAGDSGQDVLLHALLNRARSPFITATDLSGALLWYYDGGAQHATRLVEGGTILVIRDLQRMLREIDLAGNTVRETGLKAVSDQLIARGANPITSFHHEARRLPDGKTLVLAGTERVMSDVQGPGPVAIVGDMIVVLDEDLQVVWWWDTFDHLDVTRKAFGDEKCPQLCITPSPTANDWTHGNSVEYSPSDGSLLISLRHQSWVVKIDYDDGDGDGAILWKLGKDGDFTFDSADPYPWFSYQHDANFLPGQPDTISLYDNGNQRQSVPDVTHNSRGQVLKLDEAGMKVTSQLNADLGVYSFALGSAQKLTGGNFHFLSGFLPGNVAHSTETRPDGSLAFILQTQNLTYRSFRLRDLYTPGAPGGEDQSISFDAIAAKPYGAAFDLSATASSGLPVSFRVVSGPATLSGNTLTITGTGTVVVQADQVGNIKYNAARSVRQTFAADKANQTITFETLADKTFGDAPFAPAAAASSGLAVSFAAAGQCAFTGGSVHITGAGSCTLTASQAGDANFNAAVAQQTFDIDKAESTTALTFEAGPYVYRGSAFTATASATGAGGLSAPVSVVYGGDCTNVTTADGCTATATYAGDANHNGSSDSRSITISRATASVSLGSLTQTYTGSPLAATATTNPAGLGGVTFTYDGSTTAPTGAGSYAVVASLNHQNYQSGGATGTLNIKKAAPVVAATGNTCTYNGAACAGGGSATGVDGSGLGTVSLVYTPGGAAPTGAGLYTVVASVGETANHTAGSSASANITINRAAPTVSVTVPGGPVTYDGRAHPAVGFAYGVGGAGDMLSPAVTFTYNGVGAEPVNAGTYNVVASFAGNANYNPASNNAVITINKATPAITWNNPAGIVYGTPLGAAQLNAGASVAGGFAYNPPAGTVLDAGNNQKLHVDFTPNDAVNYETASKEVSVNVSKASQSITFGALANKTYGDAPFNVSASGGASGNPVAFSASGNCTAGGAQGNTITISGAGSCTVTASQAGNGNYLAASDVARSFSVAKASQSISINTHAPASAVYDGNFTVAATGGGSGNPVTYAASGACSNSGAAFTMTSGTGSCTVTYSQAGNANYEAAQATETVNAAKAAQTITFNAPADKTYGDADFDLNASVSSGLAPSFAATGACAVAGSTVHLTGAGSCTITASQAGDGNYSPAADVPRTFQIAKASQTVTFGALADKTFGDPDFSVSASASSGLAVTFAAEGSCSLDGGSTVHINGAGTCTVKASQSGDANYSAASDVSRSFSIAKAATTTALSSSSNSSGVGQELTFTATVSSTAGTPGGQVQFKVDGESLGSPVPLNAGGVAALTTSALAAGSYTVTADYGGAANFNASSGALGGAQVVGGLFEFSLPLYSVAERGGSVTVTVRRTGDVSTAASVGYATDDGSIPSVSVPCSSVTGLALGRCDYTGAAGRLDFAAGEAEKTFVVLVNDDSFVEGTETTHLRLSDASGGAALGPLTSAALEITDDQPESAGNSSDDDESFVRQHYHDFLGREPDAEGLNFWTGQITECETRPEAERQGCREIRRINVSAAFFLSIEFQNTGFFAYRIHKAASGDIDGRPVPVSFEDFIADTRALGREVVVGQTGWEQRLAANKAAYTLRFVQRPEFLARYPAQMEAAAFVDTLAASGGAVLSDADRSSLVSELSQNPADDSLRASVLRKVAENAQFAQAEKDRAFVLMQYFGYLRRDPDDAPDSDFTGYNFWLTKLNEFGGDYIAAEMVKAFLTADEYRNRFGQ